MLDDPINNHTKIAIFSKLSKKTSPGTGHIEIPRYKACVHKTVKQKSLNETSGTELYHFAERNEHKFMFRILKLC